MCSADTDILFKVANTDECSSFPEAAFAAASAPNAGQASLFDGNTGRPIFGDIVVCRVHGRDKWTTDLETVVHELLHVLVRDFLLPFCCLL